VSEIAGNFDNRILKDMTVGIKTYCSIILLSFVLRGEAITDSLLAHYPMNGNGLDISTNGFDGTLSGTTPGPDRFTVANAALSFNGFSDFVDCGNRAEFNFQGSFTVTTWVKLNGPSPSSYIIAKYADFGAENRSPRSFGLGLDLASRPYSFVSEGSSGYIETSGGSALDDNRWHAVALAYHQNSEIKLYLDGELIAQRAALGLPPFTNSVPLMIGKAANGQHFRGLIDEARIYSRALSAAELRALYLAESTADIYIVTQPSHTSIETGTNATFRIVVGGAKAAVAQFQWFENGFAIAGATNSSYATPIQEQTGRSVFTVTVHSDGFGITSQGAVLTVSKPGQRGLVAHWTFDETSGDGVLDETGSHPGQILGAQRVTGQIGSGALRFNGTNAFVLIGGRGTPLLLTNTPYTFSWWQKWEGPSGKHQAIFAMDDGADYSGGYQVYLFSGTPEIAVVHSDGLNQAWFNVARTDQNWRHYSVTFDGTDIRF
jgi:hypothetical protein